MSRIKIENGIGIGLGFGLGMFAPFGDGAFLWGVLSPGSLAPSARRSPGAIQGAAPPGPVGVPLSPGPVGVELLGALPDMAKELLTFSHFTSGKGDAS